MAYSKHEQVPIHRRHHHPGSASDSDPVEAQDWDDFETGDLRFWSLSVPQPPDTVCSPPAAIIEPVGATVVGSGVPGSLTRAVIQAALDDASAGEHLLLDQGSEPSTVVLDGTLIVRQDVILDGGGLVTLSGGNLHRVMLIERPLVGFRSVQLQRLGIVNGRRTGTTSSHIDECSGAGLLVGHDGVWQSVELIVVDCRFANNTAVVTHQDGGGGAIYARGADRLVLVDSVLEGNSGSNGGAVYTLGVREVRVSGCTFSANHATGSGGNPGSGGNAGAFGVDGAERTVHFCGSVFEDNTGNAFGAGFFSVMYDTLSLTDFVACTFTGNSNSGNFGHTGGVYLQDGPFSIVDSTFTGNSAPQYGGLSVWGSAAGEAVNSTFQGNMATDGLGGAMAITGTAEVTIDHCTIVDNHAPCDVCFAGGIFLEQSNQTEIWRSIIAANTGGLVWEDWNVKNTAADGGYNLQWPRYRPSPSGQEEDPASPTGVTWADPDLGTLTWHGSRIDTMRPNDGSPAIGLAGIYATGAPAKDARGRARTTPVDAGAFETQ
jgi:hypothetical protein